MASIDELSKLSEEKRDWNDLGGIFIFFNILY